MLILTNYHAYQIQKKEISNSVKKIKVKNAIQIRSVFIDWMRHNVYCRIKDLPALNDFPDFIRGELKEWKKKIVTEIFFTDTKIV